MTQFFRNIHLLIYLKGLCVRGSWRPNRPATYWPPLLWLTAFLSRSGCWFSLPHLISNSSDLQLVWPQLTDFLSSPGLYNDLTPTLLPASVTIAFIQPVHCQGYNIPTLLDQLFTQVHFLFWQPGRVGGQYTTLIPRCSSYWKMSQRVALDYGRPILLIYL